jgi:hypothetical protein
MDNTADFEAPVHKYSTRTGMLADLSKNGAKLQDDLENAQEQLEHSTNLFEKLKLKVKITGIKVALGGSKVLIRHMAIDLLRKEKLHGAGSAVSHKGYDEEERVKTQGDVRDYKLLVGVSMSKSEELSFHRHAGIVAPEEKIDAAASHVAEASEAQLAPSPTRGTSDVHVKEKGESETKMERDLPTPAELRRAKPLPTPAELRMARVRESMLQRIETKGSESLKTPISARKTSNMTFEKIEAMVERENAEAKEKARSLMVSKILADPSIWS